MKQGEGFLHDPAIHALPYFEGNAHQHGNSDVGARSNELRKEVEYNYDPQATPE